MSTPLPARLILIDPSANPAALAELVSAVSGAAFQLGVLGVHLTTPAAVAPGWLGKDTTEDDSDGTAAAVVLGMVTVLTAGKSGSGDGLSTRTVTTWGAQILARGRRRGAAWRQMPAGHGTTGGRRFGPGSELQVTRSGYQRPV